MVFAVTLRWAAIFTLRGYTVLVAVQATFLAVALAVLPRGRGRLLALPGMLTLIEWVRHSWPLSGLPLSGLDLSQVGSPLLSLAGIGGPLLVTMAVSVAGSLLAAAWCATTRSIRWTAVAALVALVGLSALVPTGIGTSQVGAPLAVGVVQGGGQRGIPAVVSKDDAVFGRHLAASQTIDQPVDLVLWPEDVVDVAGSFASSSRRASLSSLARALDATLVVGVVQDAQPVDDGAEVRRFRNVAVVVEPDGDLGDTYDKVIRVPFGEYVPWRPLVDRVADLSLIPREAVAGSGPGLVDTDLGSVGVSISFEGLFAERSRTAVRAGAELLLNPTNAASYVTADVPSQQVAAARMRAVESGRWVLLAGPTGPSAIIDPAGRVREASALEEQAVLQGTVARRRGLTPYGRTGDLPTLVVACGLVVAGWWVSQRRDEPPGTRSTKGSPGARWSAYSSPPVRDRSRPHAPGVSDVRERPSPGRGSGAWPSTWTCTSSR